MKYLFLIFILLTYLPVSSTPSNLLASLEMRKSDSNTASPIEKKKLKKKKRNKKLFKKPNRVQKNNKNSIKVGILFNLIGTASLSVFALLIFIAFIGFPVSIIFIILAGVSAFFALIFLTIFLVYNSVEKRNRNKKVVIKKTEQILRDEVAYLNKEKVDLYLSLNEELVAMKIQKNRLIYTEKDISAKEQAVRKSEIKYLNTKINSIQSQIKELRKQNKTMQVRRERS